MAQETTHEMLKKAVDSVAQEAIGYFCYEDLYCEVMDCDGHVECEHCDEGITDDLERCEYCEGGDNLDYCDEHNGSVLDIEYHVDARGGFIGCVVCVGTGGPHIELNTREKAVIGYWSGCEPIRAHYSDAKEVALFWEEMYENTRA